MTSEEANKNKKIRNPQRGFLIYMQEIERERERERERGGGGRGKERDVLIIQFDLDMIMLNKLCDVIMKDCRASH